MKKLLSKLPEPLFVFLKVFQYRIQMMFGKFTTSENEINLVEDLIVKGTTAIDIGANHGVYTYEMTKYAEQVIAFEPVDTNFKILSSLLGLRRNTSLMKAAATDKPGIVRMSTPVIDGYKDLYQSSISNRGESVRGMRADSMLSESNVSLIKIDAEGHDYEALMGCSGIIERDKPALIIEGDTARVQEYMTDQGYTRHTNSGPNTVYVHGS